MDNISREDMIDALIQFNKNWVMEDPDYILRFGFVGYANMTDEELTKAYKELEELNEERNMDLKDVEEFLYEQRD